MHKVDEQKNTKVVGPFLTNINYDKRRKVVFYRNFKKEALYENRLALER